MPTHRIDIPPHLVALKDGRRLEVRHGRAGDEPAIARVMVAVFPPFLAAARGDADRAIRGIIAELQPEAYVVASLADGGPTIGVTCVQGRAASRRGRIQRFRRKLSFWGVYGVLFSSVERVRQHLLESPPGPEGGGLYRYRTAVDPRYRSLGVAGHLGDFIDDYARAAGYEISWARHRGDNRSMLEMQRRRGCTLVEHPPTRLGRLLRHPGMVVSVRTIPGSAAPDGTPGAPVV